MSRNRVVFPSARPSVMALEDRALPAHLSSYSALLTVNASRVVQTAAPAPRQVTEAAALAVARSGQDKLDPKKLQEEAKKLQEEAKKLQEEAKKVSEVAERKIKEAEAEKKAAEASKDEKGVKAADAKLKELKAINDKAKAAGEAAKAAGAAAEAAGAKAVKDPKEAAKELDKAAKALAEAAKAIEAANKALCDVIRGELNGLGIPDKKIDQALEELKETEKLAGKPPSDRAFRDTTLRLVRNCLGDNATPQQFDQVLQRLKDLYRLCPPK